MEANVAPRPFLLIEIFTAGEEEHNSGTSDASIISSRFVFVDVVAMAAS